jgi:dihydropteroate synthase
LKEKLKDPRMPTQIMGILNVTPDSFHAESRSETLEKAIARGIQLEHEGADWIDVGGESTRPQAAPVSEADERARVLPVIQALRSRLTIPLSIDTYKPAVAEAALAAGATLINDITGFRDPAMRGLAAASGALVCVMHMQGTPQTMQLHPSYPEGIIPHLQAWFSQQIEALLQAGVREKQVILDPGIGFGKTVADNLQIIDNLAVLKALGFPILVGLSRKSFMAKILQTTAPHLLPSTLAMNTVAILAGADFLRVHDVAEHRAILKVLEQLKSIHA